MRNSFEQAESRRHLTDNVENKWFSDLHENVNSATPNIYEIWNEWFSNLHENVNSAKPRSVNFPSGILPEPRKRHLPLPRPLSLNVFSAQMARHIYSNPDKPSHIATHPDMPPYTSTHPAEPSPTLWCLVVHRFYEAAPSQKTLGLNNTVGSVPFRRFQVMCSTRFKPFPLRTCRTQTWSHKWRYTHLWSWFIWNHIPELVHHWQSNSNDTNSRCKHI